VCYTIGQLSTYRVAEILSGVAARLGLMPPVIEQCRHQILWRERAEHEYAYAGSDYVRLRRR
jgi:hypothetical protein